MKSTPIVQLVDLKHMHYVATPYTNYPGGLDEAAMLAAKVAGDLSLVSMHVFCPIAHGHAIAQASGNPPVMHSHDFWMWFDDPFMSWCDALIVVDMESMQQSRGVLEEISKFITMQKPVYTLDPVNLMGEVMYLPPVVSVMAEADRS